MEKRHIYGQALAHLRMKARLSQDKAAEAAGTSQPTWARYESGDSGVFYERLSTRTKMVRALGFNLGDLEAEVQALEADLTYASDAMIDDRMPGVSSEYIDLKWLISKDMRIFHIGSDAMSPYVRAGGFVVYSLTAIARAGDGVVLRGRDGELSLGFYRRQTAQGVEVETLETAADGTVRRLLTHHAMHEITGVYPIVLRADGALNA